MHRIKAKLVKWKAECSSVTRDVGRPPPVEESLHIVNILDTILCLHNLQLCPTKDPDVRHYTTLYTREVTVYLTPVHIHKI